MSAIHPTMQTVIDKFTETSRLAMMNDEQDPLAGMTYADYFAMVEALQAALPLIDGADQHSVDVRAKIEHTLIAHIERAGQLQQVAV